MLLSFLFSANILTLSVHIIFALEHNNKSIIGSHELLLYSKKVDYSSAKGFCERIGGYLIKVDEETVRGISKFPRSGEFWTGATNVGADNNQWIWLDGSMIDGQFWEVEKLRNNDTNNNSNGEVCAQISFTSWKLKPIACTKRKWFICQRGHKTSLENIKHRRLSKRQADSMPSIHNYNRSRLEFFQDKKNHSEAGKSCQSNQSRLIEIRTQHFANFIKELLCDRGGKEYWTGGKGYNDTWFWNEQWNVSMDWGWKENDTIAQTPGSCILATKLGWNDYPCKNPVGYICEQVPSRPILAQIQYHPCNSSLTVTWTPRSRPVGLNHRISVFGNGSNVTADRVPENYYQRKDVIPDIFGSTSYKVTIAPCPENPCKSQYMASITSKVPVPSITSVTTTSFSSRNCTITWKVHPLSMLDAITAFQFITERISDSAAYGNSIKTTILSKDSLDLSRSSVKYNISGHPNIKHKFGIRAQTCAELGPITWSEGYCVTDNQDPIPIIAAILSAIIVLSAILGFIVWRRRQTNSSQAISDQIEPVATVQETVTYQNSEFARKKERRSETDIKLSDFEKTYNSMLLNDGADFMFQFQNLMQEALANTAPTEVASNPTLKKMNRYKNILPFDHSRVKIENNDTGYINACYVDGFKHKQKFIASQGPLPGTLTDFWLMIAEQKCSIIVMVAKCMEAGKRKCEKYWPDHQETLRFGPVTVINTEEVVFSGFVRRILSVSAELPGESVRLNVCQYHFMKWPDHGIPPTTSCLARMHREVMQTYQTSSQSSPIVVHCSAGAGRTGTFIAYDILLSDMKNNDGVDVYRCIVTMRKQRVDMVQNCDQYILVHKLLLEEFLFKKTDLTASEAMEKFVDRSYKTQTVKHQFQNLSRIQPLAIAVHNKKEKLSSYDRMKIVLDDPSERGHSSEIDASRIEVDDWNKLIAAASPTRNSVQNFWRLIVEQRVAVIVSLIDHKSETAGFWPEEVNSVKNHGQVRVQLNDIQVEQSFQKRRFSVDFVDTKTKVTQLLFDAEGGMTSTKMSKNVLELVNEMQKESRDSSSRVVLMHCRDGSGMTGTLCAIANAIERLKLENCIDMFRVVKDLRDCREGMVKTQEQYLFCHQAIVDYLSSFDIYSNFR